jgi:CIC family chloride channel protein
VPIEKSLNGSLAWNLLLVLVVAKLIATAFTLGSGNSGGVFSPSLFMGAMLGGAFGDAIHRLFPAITATSGAYALVGMASVFAAAAHAPLTAFLIVFEMSGDYRLILPLMVTVGLSTMLSQYLRRYSIYTLKLVKKGIPLERDRDVDVMRALQVKEVMTQNPDTVRPDMSLAELSKAFSRTRHHGFPVVDDQGRLRGIVTLQDMEHASSQAPPEDQTVADITVEDMVVAYQDDPLSKALRIMSDQDFGRIPVVDRQNPTRLVGLLRRADIVRAYRDAILRKLEQQHHQETVRLGRLSETEIFEIPLTSGMSAVGQRIKDLELPAEALLTSVRRGNEVIIAHGDTLLQPGDVVVVLTQQDTAGAVRRALEGET